MEFERPQRMKMHLDISPLVDIVFQLLLFFMLTSNFMTQHGIKLNLPQAATGAPQREKLPVILVIDRQKRIFIDRKEVKLQELTPVLTAELQFRRCKTVVLKADEAVPVGLAVRVMDLARQAKGEELVVSTKQFDKAEAH
ncbi:MAG: biopolymer transporter ExbD [Bacillota bacterium]|jgi:biopolymer transport protein ExbD